jgi:hypothetical protein
MSENNLAPDLLAQSDRRRFLLAAGPFATIVPPAMTLLLSTTMSSPAIAASGAVISRGGAGGAPGGAGGVPGGDGGSGGGGAARHAGGAPGGGAGQSASPNSGNAAVANSASPDVAGRSLVAPSPDFEPAPFLTGPGGASSSKVAAAGERG